MLSPVQASLTANPSKPVRFVAPKRATTRGKKIWGRKRHLLVDTQGHLLAVKVLTASGSDLAGAKPLLLGIKDELPKMKLVWGDSHYGGTLVEWLKEQFGWTIQIVRALTVPEGSEVDWEKLFPSGFRPLPRRWVVERSLAWISRWRRLCRDHEGLPQSSEAFIRLSASLRMLTTLVPAFP